MEELLKQYEQILNRLFNADIWLKSKGIDNWELIKGKKAYIEYNKLLKEAEQLQKDLHKHYKIATY
jgi:hypothetical protein